jgi:UPF0148 protein
MSKDITRKAVDMLLNGATLLAEPCPYCKGVRVIKDGNALCIDCGKEPKQETENIPNKHESTSTLKIMQNKLEKLSKQLEKEEDPVKQQELIKTIDSLINVIDKLNKK